MHFGRLTVTLASLVPHVGARSSPVTQPQTVQGRDSESHHRRLAFPPVVPHWTTVLSSLYPESSVCSSPLIVCFPYTLDGGFRLEPWSMPGTAAFNHHQHPACKWLSGGAAYHHRGCCGWKGFILSILSQSQGCISSRSMLGASISF